MQDGGELFCFFCFGDDVMRELWQMMQDDDEFVVFVLCHGDDVAMLMPE